ncbi:MAG: 30S ribosome-binding factor RbfA [Kangiellaceae bacterium]|nr:30S ribosome-binding factor RbfA [Kangiellaceae bacterium]
MAREFKRTDRVAEQLQRELAQIIQLEVKDPRVGMVTVCAVDLSRDLHYATTYVTFLGIEETVEATQSAIDILNDAAGFIRIQIGKRMRMRAVPHVKFIFDESIARGRDLSSLIENARDKDSNSSEEDELSIDDSDIKS